jgi:hypothetical protein
MNEDEFLNGLIRRSYRNHLNFLSTNNVTPSRLLLLRSTLSSRYYNNPPDGGYQINEEHDYIFDDDDHSALIFLDATTRMASPLSDKEIKNLRRSKIREIKCKKVKESTETECPICLDEIKMGEFQKTLDCKHCFHKKCIDRWFKKDNDFCPMCRLKVIN